MSPANGEHAIPKLPVPARADRWQPLRSGVLNLYRYDYEEFHFSDGRLLLRGNNGSGKSRVLALQLPFLLDGEVSPARIEPDGDPAKRIEWNLLMGRYPDRTGYTWIEFGRRADDGTLRFLTLGCGLRAVSGHSGLHSRWFFITSQRIGRDLFLQNAQRAPLGREKLEAAIGTAGRVIQKVDDYRRAVDEALFGLGPRFAALLELLLRLRRPQLSRKLDEDELSNALSDALPTLPSTIIDDVAESFSSLQTDRGTLREFVAAREAVASFLVEYSAYVRVAVRRRANAVRSTHAAYEAAQRAVRDAERRLETATAQLDSLSRLRAELDTRLAGAEAVERTLRESPEMKTADEVRLAGEAAEQADKAWQAAADDEARASVAAQRARENLAKYESQAAEVAGELDAKRRAAASAAVAADLSEEHRQHLGRPEADPTALRFDATRESAIRRMLTQRDRAIATLAEHEKKVAAAQAAFAAADAARRAAEEKAGAARESEQTARAALAEQATGLETAYTAWRGSVRQLHPTETDALAEAFAAWVNQRDGASPFRRAAEDAQHHAVARLASVEGGLNQRDAVLAAELAEIDEAIGRLDQGETPALPPSALRRGERSGRAGAPFWRLCDFRSDVGTPERAGIEAALQASGILDAWVSLDGCLLSDVDDTFLVAPSPGATSLVKSLGDVLVVTVDANDPATAGFDVAAFERTLAAIGFGEDAGVHWVAPDGRWRLGPVSGRASKSSADYIGESTRAEHRRRQLVELRGRRAGVLQAQALVGRERDALAVDRAEAAREFAAAPSDDGVARAGFALEAATRAIAESLAAAERATQDAARHQSARDATVAARDRDAADLKLSSWLSRLDGLREATHAYATAVAGLWPAGRHWETVAGLLASQRAQANEAESEHAFRCERRDAAAGVAAAARKRFATLQEMHGETVATVLGKLRAAEEEVTTLKHELAANQKAQLAETSAKVKAEAERGTFEQQREEHERARAAAIGALQRLAEHRLLGEADSALRSVDAVGWTVSQAVDYVRHVIDKVITDDADEAAWNRRQDAIHGQIQELRDRLIAHGHQPEPHQVEDVVVVRCVFQARAHTMTELQDAFATEIGERERLLKEKEKDIIENHLLAEASMELTKLIRAAEAWRASANEELSSRPTSAGVRFRFQWEPDTEIRFNEVRPVLLRRGELWTPAERTALAVFLQGRIAAEQSADETGSWRDYLSRALDYRRWHRFVVERQQDGQWKRLNRATYGTGSGGEKALALTLPRFAAAAAHYRSAASTAPRIVMLDEAFAGIDPTMRAQCMGVLAQFDLDVVMTSELEWGCYRTVPSLAIYHLTTLPGLDAVAATRWIWNGRERRQVDTPLPPDAAPPEDAPGVTPPPDSATEPA